MNSKETVIRRWITVAAGGVLAAIVFIYFYSYSPFKNDNFFVPCYFKLFTGLECVGCGAQRSVHELLHGRFLSAFRYNPFFILVLPLVMYYIFNSVRRYIYGIPSPDNFFYSWRFGRIFIITVLLFLVLRNISW